MFPGFRNMDPYTQQHIPSPYHCYPSWEPRPLHMKMDSFNHPSACGPWSYNNQVERHSCCNRDYPSGYYSFRPPYFPYQHPPQMYYNGPYPPYHDAYTPYFIPPPHFDHARFDYDEDKSHCCGCPNHISHGKEGSNVKIEEQKATPTIDEGPVTMTKGNHNGLLQFPNNYPVMWLPDNFTRDGKIEKLMESLPMLNFKDNLKDSRQAQEESTHQGDNKVLQLPYPVVWLPGKPEEPVEDKKHIYTSPKAVEDWPSKFKILPVKFLENEKPVEELKVIENGAQHAMDRVAEKESKIKTPPVDGEPKTHTKDQVAEKEGKIKTIPVIHLDSSNDEKLSMLDKSEDVLRNCTEEKKHGITTKKDTGKKQPSPPKTSKLPPVCLRVEPLPKKNGSNGKGHSSSSPSLKAEVKPVEDNNENGAIKKKDSDIIPTVKVIDVKYQPSSEGGKETAATIVSGQDVKGIEEQCGDKDRKDTITDVGVQDKGNVGAGKEEREDVSISKPLEIVDKVEEVDISENNKKQVQKNCSPEDAALLIQSAFRGYNVRRWKPLEKLRKIAQIREQVNNIKSQIQNYGGSLELDGKQKVIISETIMNLLLQLDTIQGLLPSLREVRKSVARDLVYLQDKLDQLYSQPTNKHEGTPQQDENSSFNIAASDITLTSQEKICDGVSHVIDKHLLEQPSPSLKEENMSVQESGGSSMVSHATPVRVMNDEMVPFGDECYPAPQKEDENDREADNSLSTEGKANIVKTSESQDVAVALPPVSEVHDFVLTQQPDVDQSSNNKESQAFNEQDLNDVRYDSKHENPSISYLERQISEELIEANKQSLFEGALFEDAALKAKMESEKGSNSEEGAAIKPEGEADMEQESNAVRDPFVASEELKPTFNLVDAVDRSEKCQLEPSLLTAMHPNQEKEKTMVLISEKEDNEFNVSTETEAEPAQLGTDVPAVETGIIASTDQGGVTSLELLEPKIMDDKTAVAPEVAPESIGCADSTVETGGESNSTDFSLETRTYTQHDKSMSACSLNDEMNLKEKKLVEDNEKLRWMLEKLLHAGQEQMGVIIDLNERVKNLERKLSKRKKVKVNQKKLNKPSHPVLINDAVQS